VLVPVKVAKIKISHEGEKHMQDKRRTRGKTIFLAILVVSLVGATSAFAYRGMGGRMGGGARGMGWHMNLTPEQAGQVFDLRQKFMNDTAELRKNLMVKRAELAQLWKAETPDDKAILAKVKELSALRAQMMEKTVAQRLAVSKIVPQAKGSCPMMGPGFGPGGFGPKKGMGPGRGPGAGANPGAQGMFGDEADLDMMASNLDFGWQHDF
jgi:Spy/CpxP family protein refolding chaperone